VRRIFRGLDNAELLRARRARAAYDRGGSAMPDVTPSLHPGEVRRWVSLDQHKFSIVAGVLPPDGGKPEGFRIETTDKAIRRFIEKLGGPAGLSVCYEAGPGGFALWRLLTKLGVGCDVVAPSLIPVRSGDRVKTDRRDAKKLVSLYRAGLLRLVHPPTAELEGLRDLLRARDDVRWRGWRARNRVLKQLLRHGRIFREGKTAWTKLHRAWLGRRSRALPSRSPPACHWPTSSRPRGTRRAPGRPRRSRPSSGADGPIVSASLLAGSVRQRMSLSALLSIWG